MALSALFDDETPQIPEAAARQHLDVCADCRRWQAQAGQVNRAVRVQPADQVPDLTERVLSAVHADRGPGRPALRPTPAGAEKPPQPARLGLAARLSRVARSARWRVALRLGLALVALLQLALALPDLLASQGYGLHAGREEASFDIAIAVGFLLAAPYPERARALLPVAGILSAALLVTTGVDLIHHATTLPHELVHGLVLVEALLLWAIGRTAKSTPPGARAVIT